MSLPQLVGLNCVVCRRSIASIVEGTFCNNCGNPIHRYCASRHEQASVGRCSSCGGDPSNDLAAEVRRERELLLTRTSHARSEQPLAAEHRREPESPPCQKASTPLHIEGQQQLEANLKDVLSKTRKARLTQLTWVGWLFVLVTIGVVIGSAYLIAQAPADRVPTDSWSKYVVRVLFAAATVGFFAIGAYILEAKGIRVFRTPRKKVREHRKPVTSLDWLGALLRGHADSEDATDEQLTWVGWLLIVSILGLAAGATILFTYQITLDRPPLLFVLVVIPLVLIAIAIGIVLVAIATRLLEAKGVPVLRSPMQALESTVVGMPMALDLLKIAQGAQKPESVDYEGAIGAHRDRPFVQRYFKGVLKSTTVVEQKSNSAGLSCPVVSAQASNMPAALQFRDGNIGALIWRQDDDVVWLRSFPIVGHGGVWVIGSWFDVGDPKNWDIAPPGRQHFAGRSIYNSLAEALDALEATKPGRQSENPK
jgi:hypothetical protein